MSDRFLTILNKSKLILPETFLSNIDNVDVKLGAYLELVLTEINIFPPQTEYTVENMPAPWDNLLVFGSTVFSAMFLQLDVTLKDFDYSDNGLSVRVDQVGKLDTGMKNLLTTYKTMVEQAKTHEITKIIGIGTGTPRFQSVIGSFIRIALGDAWPSGVESPRGMY